MLGFIAAGLGFRDHRKRISETNGVPPPSFPESTTVPDVCCGQHDVCEQFRSTATAGKKIDYYDDEELDAYCGMASNAYSDTMADKFREVLYTLNEAEIAGWIRSLQLRGINLPDTLKDEAYMIIGEQRRDYN
ncbi:MAG: phospholipase [Dysgonamonadaceae bacterium]|jgi:hypothetical protein|nr:phospholipase [Dysgonamonadaceae bacterium]